MKTSEIVFSVYADSPYRPPDESFMNQYLVADREDPEVEFIVHLGDIVDDFKNDSVPEKYLRWFCKFMVGDSSKPVFVCLGDNEYNDLEDPNVEMEKWSRLIDKPLSHSSGTKVPLFKYPVSQDALPGLFRFEVRGVVFSSLVVPGARFDGKQALSKDRRAEFRAKNLAWLRECSAQARDKMLVVLSHRWPWFKESGISTRTEAERWRSGLLEVLNSRTKRTLMIYGDLHSYSRLKDHQYFRVSTIGAPRTTMTGDGGPPLLVRVDAAGAVEVQRGPVGLAPRDRRTRPLQRTADAAR